MIPGYRVRHGANFCLQRLHLLTMLNPGQCQARETHEDHRHPDDPGTDDRATLLLSSLDTGRT